LKKFPARKNKRSFRRGQIENTGKKRKKERKKNRN
jgi:hypothetical protein